jgi:fibronectin type 3 domain-containing protein
MPGGSGLAGYKVYRGNLPVVAVTGTSYTDTDLQPNASYIYTVVAFDGAGNHSSPSNSISFTTAFPPAPPSNLSATAISPSQINLSWTDNSSDETGFKIERKTGAGGTWSQVTTVGANVTSYPDTGLSSATTYYYRVRSYGPGGDSAYSNEASATTPAPQPTSLSISPGSLYQWECYTMTAGNGDNMTLDVQYTFNGGAVQQINAWPTLNASGQATICTDSQTPPGTYTFTAIRNTLNTSWVSVNASVTVLAP